MAVDMITDLVIGGDVVAARSGARLDDLDPATGEVIAAVADAGPEDVDAAIAAARAAQPAWGARHPRDRGQVLLALAALIRSEAADLSRLESIDTGKPLSQAAADVEVAAQYFEFYGGFADKLYGDTIPLGSGRLGYTVHEPRGVTAHIVPWNYPLQIGSRTIAPSLMAGNACVVKPAEEASLTALAVATMALRAGLPPGVLNVVPGRGEVAGAHLAASDDIDSLSFTGGLETGRLVMTAAARNVKPVTLELGGKSPSIVLADGDLDRALPVVAKALIQNAGQTCSAGTRVIAHESIYDELVGRLAVLLEKVSLGRGVDNPDMGPLISDTQRNRVTGYVHVGTSEGARLATGGGPAEVAGCPGGYFMQPTVFADVTPDMRIANEEIFGPVLAALRCGDDREALAIANGTPFGLIASVWTRDIDRALWFAERLQAGQVYVNSYGAAGGVGLPFGGNKHSGFGREKGLEAIHECTNVKTVVIETAPPLAATSPSRS
ncbi:MAG TPA: aldehyde dehydrogenase family protein [Acidimicrobiales bacterium]|jgi:acyl-CoA reductase-like NAD-dependent aldehyde dehydrogenase|nr:aldehyde dehydrogenase family protein [Acidimicrobiales bacterium]